MDLSRFKTLAEGYGAERRRWPEAARPLYDRFAGTPEGATILAQAESIDRFLDALKVSASDGGLAQAIVAEALSSSAGPGDGGAESGGRIRRERLGWRLGAFAASAIIGFALGFAQAGDDAGVDFVTQLLGPASVQEIGL
jgi:hypothetical protein